MDATQSTDPFLHFHPSSPLRLPCWRWGWANYLLETKLPVRRKYRDDWFNRTLKYLRASRRMDNPDHPRLARLDPELFAAHRLALGDPRTIFELELRVLSGQSYARIAECCLVTSQVIVVYEHVFYDMRCMFDAEWAVLARIRRPPLLPFTRLDLEALIRVVAFMQGPCTMEPVLRYYDERYYPSRIAATPDPTPRLTKMVGDSVELRVWAMDPANLKGLLHLIWLHGWAERSTSRNDSTALFRPLTGIVASVAAADPASAAPHGAADFSADQVFRDPGDAAPGEPESRPAPPTMARVE